MLNMTPKEAEAHWHGVAWDVAERAIAFGTGVAIIKDGAITEVTPEQYLREVKC